MLAKSGKIPAITSFTGFFELSGSVLWPGWLTFHGKKDYPVVVSVVLMGAINSLICFGVACPLMC